MRVYGSSPLYKYLELIFRSRRLFLISFLIATAATTFIFFWQPSKYVAKGYYTLSGSKASVQDPNYRESESERALIKNRISQLNVALQHPGFFADALSTFGIDRDKYNNQLSQYDRDKLYTNARKATTFSANDNYLEITCTWPNGPQARRIINAVWQTYSDRVVAEEGKAATAQSTALTSLEKVYGSKRDAIDQQVKSYQQKHTHIPEIEPAAAANQYYVQTQEVERGKNELRIAQSGLEILQAKLKNTPQTRPDQVMKGPLGQDAIFAAAQDDVDKATKDFADVQAHATPANPRYKEAEAKLKKAQDKLASLNLPGSAASQAPKHILRTVDVFNPEYDKLSSQVTDQNLRIRQLQMALASAEHTLSESAHRATTAPQDQYEFKRLTQDLTLYTQIHESLKARLEQSNIDAKTAEATARGSLGSVYEVKAPTGAILDDGVVVDKESSTKRYVVLAAGPLLGLVVGFAFSLLGESLDHSIRTPAEVEKFLGKPVLAILPSMKTGRGAKRQIGGDTQPTLPPA